MRVERHRVAVGEHPSHERRGVVGDVSIDQKEGRADTFARQQVEQVRRRRRIRTVIERQIHRRRLALRHVPDRSLAGDSVEQKRRRGRVRERHDSGADRDQNPHQRRRPLPVHHEDTKCICIFCVTEAPILLIVPPRPTIVPAGMSRCCVACSVRIAAPRATGR